LAIDRKIAGGTVDYAIETDNVEAGRSAAKFFAEACGGAETEVLMLVSDPTATALRERQEGFKGEVQNYPNMKLVAEPSIGTSTEKAYNATVDAFKANPDIRVIFTSGDIWVAPIQSALKEIGKLVGPEDPNHVMIGSVDGEKLARTASRKASRMWSSPSSLPIFPKNAWRSPSAWPKARRRKPRRSCIPLSSSAVKISTAWDRISSGAWRADLR
jgi:ABC-type sugar transport system substrate-binding protein